MTLDVVPPRRLNHGLLDEELDLDLREHRLALAVDEDVLPGVRVLEDDSPRLRADRVRG